MFDPNNPRSFANRTKSSTPPNNDYSKPSNKNVLSNTTSLDRSAHARKSWSDQMDDEEIPHRSPNTPAMKITDTQRILNKLDAITETLTTLYNDLAFSIHRLDIVEKHLNIFTLTPKKVAELNDANATDNVMDTDTKYESEVDTSDSKVTENEKQIAWLHNENEELRKHNKITVEKLNVALRAVASIQRFVLEDTHPSHIIPIPKLNPLGNILTMEDGSEVPPTDLFFK